MNTTPDQARLRLFVNWPSRPRTLGNFIDDCRGFLVQLRPLHPLFRDELHFLGSTRSNSPALDPDLANLEPVLLSRAWDMGEGTADIIGLGEGEQPTRETTSRMGFRCDLDNLRPHRTDHLQISFSGGSTNPEQGGGVSIALPFDADPVLWDAAFLIPLFRLFVDYWRPEQGGIWSHQLAQVSRQRGSYARPISWLNYSDEPAIADALPSDIDWCAFAPGLLFSLQPQPPREITAELADKALRVRDALSKGEWMVARHSRGKGLLPSIDPADCKEIIRPGVLERLPTAKP
jgi:hypothetical protein